MFVCHLRLDCSFSHHFQTGIAVCALSWDEVVVVLSWRPWWWIYQGADKSLARPGRKQACKHVRDARYFNNIETRAVIRFLWLQGKGPKEIQRHSDWNIGLFGYYRHAGKSLARPGRKQAWKHVRDARYFNNIKTRAVIRFLWLQGKGPKEIQRHSDWNIGLFTTGVLVSP